MIAFRWFIALFVISASLVALFGYKSALNEAHANQSMGESAATIEAMHIALSPYQQSTSVVGINHSVQVVELTNELRGKIDKINFASGDLVKKGQVLIEQDYSEESARLIAAMARTAYQQDVLKRYRTLRQDDMISEEIINKAVMDLKVSESEVAVLEAIIHKKTIRAPFNARAGIHNFQVGQYLEENSAITSLVGVDDYAWVDFYVPQTYDELAMRTLVKVAITGQSP
ncbi:MAG: efflux RND transporter periplasmic adaptor subunit, partial [Pseudomonadota bacterium]|nr:efflux RND transporter periplasmic adaptor subunit [Pseudomonadota bacterium]